MNSDQHFNKKLPMTVDNLEEDQLNFNQTKFNLITIHKTENDQINETQRTVREFVQDKLGKRYSKCIEKLYLYGKQNGLNEKEQLKRLYELKNDLISNECALNKLPIKLPNNRINNQLNKQSNSLNSHSDNLSINELNNYQNNFLNIEQLETFFKDSNLEEIDLLINEQDKLIDNNCLNNSINENCLNKLITIQHPNDILIDNNLNKQLINQPINLKQNIKCLNKSSKSKFLAKRNRNKMNKDILVNDNLTTSANTKISKWINQMDSIENSPILSPISSNNSSGEYAIISSEMRLSNLGSSTFSLCSRSSSVNINGDTKSHDIDFNEQTNELRNNKKYQFDITRSMPSLDLIESLNSNSLPRLLKQSSQPKLNIYNQKDLFEKDSLTDTNQIDSIDQNQKLIMTRFGFIKNVPAAKNLILNNSSTSLNRKELQNKKNSNQITNEINKKTSISSLDLTNHHKQINEQLINTTNLSNNNLSSNNLLNNSLPNYGFQKNKSINHRSLSALTINCDNKLNKSSFKSFNCTICSSNLCKCKLKANSLLTINRVCKPKLFEKATVDDQLKNSSTGLQIEKDDAINCCNKHVDLYITNKQLVNDNLKLQEKFDDLFETVQQIKNKEEKAANEQINSLQRKIELLTLELQEAKDEKELMEFRLFELECNGMPIETYKYHKTKDAFRNFKNVTRTASGLSNNDENSSVTDTTSSTSSSDETKDQIDLLDCKNNQHLLFTNSSVILTSEDEGLGHDDHSRRSLYRSEDSGPSSLENLSNNNKNLKAINNENEIKDNNQSNKIDRCTSPLMNVNELEQQLNKLEKHNNELIEQNLELEEAENDSRLVSQKLKIKLDNLQINLEQAQEYIKTSENKLNESKKREEILMEQIKELQIKLEEENNISSLSTINSLDDWNFKSPSSLNEFQSINMDNNPICNSINAVKIDLCMNNSMNSNEQFDSLNEQTNKLDDLNNSLTKFNDESIDMQLKTLENNQYELNDRLKHLQTVNKEFVKDLEQREHLLTRKELLFKEWITKENLLRRSISELNNELDEMNKQLNLTQRQRAELRKRCEELHQQLTALENDNQDQEQLLSLKQKEMHELITNCKQQEYDHRLIELLNKLLNKFDEQCTKEMEKEEQTQVILDKFCSQDQELQENMRRLTSRQNEIKDQINKQKNNLEKLNKSYEEGIEKLEQERLKISNKLRETILIMEKCTSKTIEDNQHERNQIKEKLNETISKYKTSLDNYEKLIQKINSKNSDDDQQKKLIIKSANDQILNKYEQEAVNKFQEEQITSLLNEREELKNRLLNLEQTIEQHIQKEAAYKETLIKADKIVYEMESQYKEQISQLEANEKILNERIVDLEKEQLNIKLKNSNIRTNLTAKLALNQDNTFNLLPTTNSPNKSTAVVSGLSSPTTIRRNSELMAELLKSETRECQLREQINKLEQNELNLKKYLERAYDEKQQLESDLLEIEDLNLKIEKLRRELHQSMHQLDLEREKNQQKDEQFKKELKELLDENQELRYVINQQTKLINKDLNYVNNDSSQLNLKTGCDNIKLNKNHVLQININDNTNTKQNSIRLHCN